MTNILDDQVDELLRKAEQRLRHDAVAVSPSHTHSAAELKPSVSTSAGKSSTQQKDLAVRAPIPTLKGPRTQARSTAGPNWFDLPKTQLTPEFKRDWQLLRMRGVLDPKHQKKALRASAPEFSQVGEIIAGPTEFHSARLSRKDRKRTMLEEVMSTYNDSKFSVKYAGIQKQKMSGKKAFYQKLVSQRRKRQN